MTQQSNIFEMFGLVDELEDKKKVEAAEKKAKEDALREAEKETRNAEMKAKMEASKVASQEKAKETKPKEEVFTPNENTVIRFYGESIDIHTYFSTEELVEGLLVKKKEGENERKPLTPELLRARMEKDFPELVKDHTEIVFLKDKNMIVPMIKAKKKGADVADFATSFPFPIIPFNILGEFIEVAQSLGNFNFEVHGDIYLNPATQTYFLDIPQQKVHKFWVEVTESAGSIVSRIEDAIKVCEIHSHHSMLPNPSSQDNESERVPGMHYVIVGNTNMFFPSITARTFISGIQGHRKVAVSNIFDSPFKLSPSSFDIANIDFCYDAMEVR